MLEWNLCSIFAHIIKNSNNVASMSMLMIILIIFLKSFFECNTYTGKLIKITTIADRLRMPRAYTATCSRSSKARSRGYSSRGFTEKHARPKHQDRLQQAEKPDTS